MNNETNLGAYQYSWLRTRIIEDGERTSATVISQSSLPSFAPIRNRDINRSATEIIPIIMNVECIAYTSTVRSS